MTELAFFIASGLMLLGCVYLWRRAQLHSKKLSASLVCVAFALFLIGGYELWFTHRAAPERIRQTLFAGVVYQREARRVPRLLVIHVVTIDLTMPELRFFVTPGEAVNGGELRARTTSQFLEEFHVQLAINGSFFEPFWTHSPLDYYPHSGDPVDVTGFAASSGRAYSQAELHHPTLAIMRNSKSFD